MANKNSSVLKSFARTSGQAGQSGLTFLEVILAIMILLTLTIAAAQMIRSGVEIQISMSERGKVQHRLDVAIQRITDDLKHSFIINRKRPEVYYTSRKFKTYFSIDRQSGSSILKMTTTNHRPMMASANESDQNFVQYKVERDLDTGVAHLYRGQMNYIPDDFDAEVQWRVLSKNIKTLSIEAWDGSKWVEEWDSDKSDFRDLLPHMVKVQIEAYAIDYPEGERAEDVERDPTETILTVVNLPRAKVNKEVKDRPSSPKIF